MKIYEVDIAGVKHTLQYSDAEAKRLGLEGKEVKPKNKQVKPKNKQVDPKTKPNKKDAPGNAGSEK